MTTTIRAAIMLSVLVGLPAAWVYYGPLPPQAQRVVDRFVATAKEAIDWDKVATDLDDKRAPPAAAGAPAPSSAPAFAPAPAAETAELATRVEPLLAKLRELGVAEYALEPWGGARQLYRFHCEMPLGGDAQITEQFEAIAADPQASVAQVVADVASWHAGRSAGSLR